MKCFTCHSTVISRIRPTSNIIGHIGFCIITAKVVRVRSNEYWERLKVGMTANLWNFHTSPHTDTRYILLSITYPGVTDIEANVEAKTVVVTHSDAVTKEEMLEKLQKVSRWECRGRFSDKLMWHLTHRYPHWYWKCIVVASKWEICRFGIHLAP